MRQIFADPDERFASLVRAGSGVVEMAGSGPRDAVRVPVAFAALQRQTLVLGLLVDAPPGRFSATSVRCELFDQLTATELGPHAAGLLSACGGACLAGAAAGCVGVGPHAAEPRLVRSVATVQGALTLLDDAAARTAALDLAESLPHPELLAVGSGIRMAELHPRTVDLVDARGAARIEPFELELADPDPFCDIEAIWLARLNDPRTGVMRRIVEELHARRTAGAGEVLAAPGPVFATALDRFGVTISARDPGGIRREVRLAFEGDCAGIEDLAREIRRLCGDGGAEHFPGPLLRGRDAR